MNILFIGDIVGRPERKNRQQRVSAVDRVHHCADGAVAAGRNDERQLVRFAQQ